MGRQLSLFCRRPPTGSRKVSIIYTLWLFRQLRELRNRPKINALPLWYAYCLIFSIDKAVTGLAIDGTTNGNRNVADAVSRHGLRWRSCASS